MNTKRKTQLLSSFKNSKIMQLFKAQCTAAAEGYFEIKILRQDFMLRPAGMYNGSTISALVDVSSGYAAAAANNLDSYFSTVELKINFLNPAIGENLIAKAQVIKNGKRLIVVRSDIFSEQHDTEILVATSLVTLIHLRSSGSNSQID